MACYTNVSRHFVYITHALQFLYKMAPHTHVKFFKAFQLVIFTHKVLNKT
jgi:hypothetical protein